MFLWNYIRWPSFVLEQRWLLSFLTLWLGTFGCPIVLTNCPYSVSLRCQKPQRNVLVSLRPAEKGMQCYSICHLHQLPCNHMAAVTVNHQLHCQWVILVVCCKLHADIHIWPQRRRRANLPSAFAYHTTLWHRASASQPRSVTIFSISLGRTGHTDIWTIPVGSYSPRILAPGFAPQILVQYCYKYVVPKIKNRGPTFLVKY